MIPESDRIIPTKSRCRTARHLGQEKTGVVKEMAVRGCDKMLEKSQALFFRLIQDNLPDAALYMGPSGSQHEPGEEGSIFRPC
jgi:hypothetical protein